MLVPRAISLSAYRPMMHLSLFFMVAGFLVMVIIVTMRRFSVPIEGSTGMRALLHWSPIVGNTDVEHSIIEMYGIKDGVVGNSISHDKDMDGVRHTIVGVHPSLRLHLNNWIHTRDAYRQRWYVLMNEGLDLKWSSQVKDHPEFQVHPRRLSKEDDTETYGIGMDGVQWSGIDELSQNTHRLLGQLNLADEDHFQPNPHHHQTNSNSKTVSDDEEVVEEGKVDVKKEKKEQSRVMPPIDVAAAEQRLLDKFQDLGLNGYFSSLQRIHQYRQITPCHTIYVYSVHPETASEGELNNLKATMNLFKNKKMTCVFNIIPLIPFDNGMVGFDELEDALKTADARGYSFDNGPRVTNSSIRYLAGLHAMSLYGTGTITHKAHMAPWISVLDGSARVSSRRGLDAIVTHMASGMVRHMIAPRNGNGINSRKLEEEQEAVPAPTTNWMAKFMKPIKVLFGHAVEEVEPIYDDEARSKMRERAKSRGIQVPSVSILPGQSFEDVVCRLDGMQTVTLKQSQSSDDEVSPNANHGMGYNDRTVTSGFNCNYPFANSEDHSHETASLVFTRDDCHGIDMSVVNVKLSPAGAFLLSTVHDLVDKSIPADWALQQVMDRLAGVEMRDIINTCRGDQWDGLQVPSVNYETWYNKAEQAIIDHADDLVHKTQTGWLEAAKLFETEADKRSMMRVMSLESQHGVRSLISRHIDTRRIGVEKNTFLYADGVDKAVVKVRKGEYVAPHNLDGYGGDSGEDADVISIPNQIIRTIERSAAHWMEPNGIQPLLQLGNSPNLQGEFSLRGPTMMLLARGNSFVNRCEKKEELCTSWINGGCEKESHCAEK